jgi:hypothetical protein
MDIYRKLIWGTLVPGHHASNTYILLTIMHTQGYTYPRYIYPTHIYPKYAYPRYIYPGYTYPIYIYPEYVYICTFIYLRYIFQKNISKVYIPHLCLLSMCKVIYTLGYVQNITYFVRIEHGARVPWLFYRYIYIYIYRRGFTGHPASCAYLHGRWMIGSTCTTGSYLRMHPLASTERRERRRTMFCFSEKMTMHAVRQ